MTTNSYSPAPTYTISGIGPYDVPHDYASSNELIVSVVIDDVAIALDVADYSVVPEGPTTSGTVFLTPAAAATHDGETLTIARDSNVAQNWLGLGSTAAGLEAQLDQMTRAIQENQIATERSLRVLGEEVFPYQPQDGRVPYWDSGIGSFANGLNYADLVAGIDAGNAASARADIAFNAISGGKWRTDAATLFADTSLTYSADQSDTVVEGTKIVTQAEGFGYSVAGSAATDHHVTTAGGVKLYVLPDADGSFSVAAFGAVGDGVTDDTLAFQTALSATFDVFVPEGDYLITDTLDVDQKSLRGQNGNIAKLLFDHVNGDFAVKVQTGQRGGGIQNMSIEAVSDGLKGVLLSGTVILRAQQLYINGFTETAMQLGNSGAGEGIYWSKVAGVRIGLDAAKTGTTGVLVEGAAIPGSNANTIEDLVIGGNYARPLHIQGRGNTVVGGTIEMFDATAVTSMVYFEGSGNHVSGIYCEPVGTPPDTLVEFGSGATGNYLEIWPQFAPAHNISAMIIDGGAHNKVKVRRAGANFRIGPEAEPGANLLANSAFDVWRDAENPVGWLFGTPGSISHVAPEETGGPSILRMTLTSSAATIQSYMSPYFEATSGALPIDMQRLRGKPVVCGVWCRTAIPGAGGVKLMSGTGGITYSGADTHSGSGDWELLLAHGNVLEAHDRVGMELRSHVTNATQTGTVDFRDPFFVVGSDIPYFSPKPLIDAGGKVFGDLEFPLDHSDKGLGGVLKLGASYVWADTVGRLRISSTRPTDATWDTAGAVVGTQS